MTMIPMSALAEMTPAARETALAALVRQARNPSATSRASVESRVRAFEIRYEMSSDEMLRRVRASELRETADIAEWLFYLEVRQPGVSA